VLLGSTGSRGVTRRQRLFRSTGHVLGFIALLGRAAEEVVAPLGTAVEGVAAPLGRLIMIMAA